MRFLIAALLLVTLAPAAGAQPSVDGGHEVPGQTMKRTGGLLIGLGLASAGTALLLDRTMGSGLASPFDSRKNDALANMLDGGLVVAGVGVSFGLAAWIVARDARAENIRIDASASGQGGVLRARVTGDVWISSQGLHF